MRVQAGRPRPPAGAVALCLALVLGCGAAAGAAVLGAGDTTTVIVAARPLTAGSVVSEQDLAPAELAGSDLSAVPATAGGSLLGKTVLGPVPAGTLLNARMFTDQSAPAPGQVAVGLALVPGQLPAEPAAGRQVVLLRLPAPAGQTAQGAGDGSAGEVGADGPDGGGRGVSVLVPSAKVLSSQTTSAGGTLLTVLVREADAPAVAGAGAAGLVSVGLLPVGVG